MLIHADILICVTSVKARQPDIVCLLETVQEEVDRMCYSCRNLIKTVCLMIGVCIENTGRERCIIEGLIKSQHEVANSQSAYSKFIKTNESVSSINVIKGRRMEKYLMN